MTRSSPPQSSCSPRERRWCSAARRWGELGDLRPTRFSGDSLIAFAYLVIPGSLLAYTAFVWLLRNAPIGTVATYAYVNPVVAVVVGALLLGERITPSVLAGGALILSSVALVVGASASRAR